MTRLDPSLIVTRMLIERDKSAVYDERFHRGVNIIRGENSSGKSTILNFLFYALGGDLADWSEVALLCSRVMVEVLINGKPATLSREISSQTGQPMDIFGGAIDDALRAPMAEWSRYPYKRSNGKESFSQALFRLYQMPEVKNDSSANITMHQLLRLLYADQLSPIEHIFKFERFDPPSLREALGRLVCGVYDNQLYENELRIREVNKQFESVSAELRSLIAVLGKTQDAMTLDWVAGERLSLTDRRNALRKEIEDAEKQSFSSPTTDPLTLKAQDDIYKEVQVLQESLGKLQEEYDSIAFAIADSNAFIASHEQKLKALNDAGMVADHIGEMRFLSCPACFAPIDAETTDHACHLCKTPFDSERTKGRIVALINDIALQLRQSKTLQERRQAEAGRLLEVIRTTTELWKSASIRLVDTRKLPTSEAQDILRELHRQAGYLDREIEDLENKASIIQLIDALSKKKVEFNAEMTRLRADNDIRNAEQQKRLSRAYTLVSDEIRDLLHKDLRRQDSFEHAQNIQFDFAANNITVDGQPYFSASSRAILKSSFFVGMLAAALKEPFFRHPRFCLIDTIEDKGMEAVRSQNFQHLMVNISDSTDVEHQIIFATAMVATDLDTDKYTVGKASTRDDPTLKIFS
ncbi:MAG: AAA family ATPase [Alphaproteobacteria bacterium]|nr:AAA family ATPase [Alphaproteobacteria bacterium]